VFHKKEEKMKKYISISGLAMIVLVCMMVVPSFARAPNYQAHRERPLKPKRAVLHMFQRSQGDERLLTRRAARGKLNYWLWGETFNFFFQGRRLIPHTRYVLIYMPAFSENMVWTEGYGEVLGSGTAGKRGRVLIIGSKDTCNMGSDEEGPSEIVGHIWLVPAPDYIETEFYDVGSLTVDIEPGEYIEGFHTIRFMDTDGCADDTGEGGVGEDPYDEAPEGPADENPEGNEPGPIIPSGAY
jgi:hypothetical protein